MTTTNETDLLGLTRATKKLTYWQDLADKGITHITSEDDGIVYEVTERIEYWLKQINKYRVRIDKHIENFKNISNPFEFVQWIAGIVQTIKDIIQSLTK